MMTEHEIEEFLAAFSASILLCHQDAPFDSPCQILESIALSAKIAHEQLHADFDPECTVN